MKLFTMPTSWDVTLVLCIEEISPSSKPIPLFLLAIKALATFSIPLRWLIIWALVRLLLIFLCHPYLLLVGLLFLYHRLKELKTHIHSLRWLDTLLTDGRCLHWEAHFNHFMGGDFLLYLLIIAREFVVDNLVSQTIVILGVMGDILIQDGLHPSTSVQLQGH